MDTLDNKQIIELLRKRQGTKSLRSLAVEVNCTPAYLSDLFRGKRTPGNKIFKFLGLNVEKLVTVQYQVTKKRK